MKTHVIFLSVLIVIGCTPDIPSAPICRIKATQLDPHEGNAGCIIRVGQRVLTIKHKYTNKLDIPGGKSNDGESAQCTAHRETWEETGFNVEVGELLGQRENGFRFYQCQLDDDFGGEVTNFPVPEWSENEVKGIQLVEPFSTTHKDWRFPDQLTKYRSMFVTAGKTTQEPPSK